MSGPPILRVKGLRVAYGAIEALHGVDLEVPAGEVVALIGANGAGKTTTLRAVSRMLRPSAGRVRFLGEDLARGDLQRDPAQRLDRAVVHVEVAHLEDGPVRRHRSAGRRRAAGHDAASGPPAGTAMCFSSR